MQFDVPGQKLPGPTPLPDLLPSAAVVPHSKKTLYGAPSWKMVPVIVAVVVVMPEAAPVWRIGACCTICAETERLGGSASTHVVEVPEQAPDHWLV